MAANKFAHLVGDYQSDSDNDDSEHKQSTVNSITTDWTQCTDANSGHPYYWNIVTKEVTWEIPIEYEQFLEQVALTNPPTFRKWILCYTDDNAPYYFNEVTREISWEKPDDFTESSSSVLNSPSRSNSRQSNVGDSSVRVTAKTMLNLVPEYNSDDSDDESSTPTEITTEKPLFPSSSNSYTTKSHLIKSVENSNEVAPEKLESQPSNTSKKTEYLLKEKPSFASIITGGRSPQHETVDIKLYTGEDVDETSNKKDETTADAEPLSQKTFQRKRRIEFNVSSTHPKRANHTDDDNSSNEPKDTSSTAAASLKSKYGNFQKGETEYLEKPSSSDSVEPEPMNNIEKDDTREQQELLEAKLKFLCEGRTEVSPVQVIQIQLQALQAAHVAEALHSNYLLEWMKSISNDLIKLESDAAPNGWKCLWNREKAQYCYENTDTGEIKWEYPEDEETETAVQDDAVPDDDDAMDICMTPPPNEHENLSAAYFQTTTTTTTTTTTEHYAADCVLPQPKWSSEIDNKEKPLDDELASFYSDIAKLEPEATNEDNSCDKSSPTPDPPASPENSVSDGDEKKKKKKKKTRKLKPWRSGNLETWINKWQKAQKELDG